MKYLVFTILFLSHQIGFCQSDSLENQGNTNLLMTPNGYSQLNLATGFLNDDDIQDFAIIVQSKDQANVSIDPITKDTINLNPRILAIYFGDDKGYFQKQLQVNNFILLNTSDLFKDPLIDFTITKNGILKIDFKIYSYSEGWMNTCYSYHFNYQNNVFNLINYQSNSKHNVTRKAIEHKFDFLKGKKTTLTTTLDENRKKHIDKKSTRFKLKELQSLKSLQTPFKWEFMGIHI